jgi:hypothetical protein
MAAEAISLNWKSTTKSALNEPIWRFPTAASLAEPKAQTRQAKSDLRSERKHTCGPSDALAGRMQLVPNPMPPERLLSSMDAQEGVPVADDCESPFVLKGANVMSGNGRWIFIGLTVGAMLISIGGVIFSRHVAKEGGRFVFPPLIKARTCSLADGPGSAATPAPIVIALSTNMIRVSAIALGHPRLAVINGKTVTEGESVTLQAPNSSVALILRVAKIGDGRIDLSDGKKMFSAQLTIPSPAQPKVR